MVNCQLFSIVTKVGGSRVRVRTRSCMTRLIKLHTPARLRRLVGGLVANRRLPYFEFNTFPSLVDDKSGKTLLSHPRPMFALSRLAALDPHTENKPVKKKEGRCSIRVIEIIYIFSRRRIFLKIVYIFQAKSALKIKNTVRISWIERGKNWKKIFRRNTVLRNRANSVEAKKRERLFAERDKS